MAVHRNDRAFTLIELAVVIAVVGVLALVAAPNMARFRDKYRLTRVANDYLSTVNLIRLQAIAENRKLRIYHYPDDDYADESSATLCKWDVRAETAPNSGSWETIPIDGVEGENNDYQTGFYNYSDEASPKFVPNISMMDTGQIETLTWYEFSTRGTISDYSGNSDQSNSGCLKLVGFRNKSNNALSRMQVCVGTSGIAKLRS